MTNKKFFVVSDIHSFATSLLENLKLAGFRKSNKNHILIVCGDIFDRGFETMEVYKFLKSLPKSRCILIRGNHEDLYFKLLEKDFPQSHDYSNGTVLTFAQIAGVDHYELSTWYSDNPKAKWEEVREIVANSEVTKWLKSKQWVNYYELENYIFVHSFIPTKVKESRLFLDLAPHRRQPDDLEIDKDWRNADEKEWYSATWGCPYKQFRAGLFNHEIENNKKLVCGHWHASDFHKVFDTSGRFSDYDIYFGDNLIALDACTALTQQTNVLVIDEANCFDQYGIRLGE